LRNCLSTLDSQAFTQALFTLASRPEYIQPIREEVEAVIAAEGWSKVAMTRMRKLDSFLKESARLNPLGARESQNATFKLALICTDSTLVTMTRKALKDFTFSDGTRIPKGGIVSVASLYRHRDDDVYPHAGTFDGFRFSEIREEDEGTKHQMVATSTEYLPFGHGRHAWCVYRHPTPMYNLIMFLTWRAEVPAVSSLQTS